MMGFTAFYPSYGAQDKVKQLQVGDILEVIGTDPGVMQDIPTWCRINGHKILSAENIEGEYIIVLEVGE